MSKKKNSYKKFSLKKKIILICVSIISLAIISFFTGFGIYAYKLNKAIPMELSSEVLQQNQSVIK